MNLFNQDTKVIQVEKKSDLILVSGEIKAFEKDIESERQLHEIASKSILQQLLKLGLKDIIATEKSLEICFEKLGMDIKFFKLFEELIRTLKESGYIIDSGEPEISDSIISELESFQAKDALDSLTSLNKAYVPHANLLLSCLNSFNEIVTGKIKATEIIFPNGSMDLVKEIYKGNYTADFFNELLCNLVFSTVKKGVSEISNDEKIKILEVGAGTGGTSELLFKILKPFEAHIEYTYTDLSKSFLLFAERQYKEIAPYMVTKVFDIEKSPQDQGILQGEYDIVIGANVVHATKNIGITTRNIKNVLKKDGLLLMNELAKTELFTTLTFGLLDGWWMYEDNSVRLQGSPGLSSEGWETVLEEEGYENFQSFPKDEVLSYQVIAAKSNGEIRLDTVKKEINPQAVKTTANTVKSSIVLETLIDQLIVVAADTIGLPQEEFDPEEQFMDYGFDSIMGTSLMNNINEKFNVSLKATDVFNYPNIVQLANYILETFPEQFQSSEVSIDEKLEDVIDEIANDFVEDVPEETIDELSKYDDQDIAVIGMSGQYGKTANLAEFWKALVNGENLIEEVPSDRWDPAIYFSEDKNDPNKTYSKWGSFLRDIDKFDPLFFKISGSDAEVMDPQQRIFLQHCWKAFEDAAIQPDTLKSAKCGVYVGTGDSGYLNNIQDQAASAFWGNAASILASRISYFLDLKGPAIAIDTACSSSLVALDLACTSLLKKDTDIALAGGVMIMNSPDFYILSSRAGMLSPDGQCYAFDSRANGFVPGEGVGVLVLKRKKDAERDGDQIYGIIKGCITNQDGKTNGITAPSAISQTNLEKEIYTKLNINPETISYVESHGTGTSLGDPIEFDALTTAYRAFTSKTQFCSIGSVKTNIGHSLMAAGVAGVIKVLLSMKYKKLVPSINFQSPNALINLDNSPFRIQTELEDWKANDTNPRRATVSSFGFSGTNAHVILEEYNSQKLPVKHSNLPAFVLLSAKTQERLKEKAHDLLVFLKDDKELIDVYDLAFTLQNGREHMEERIALIVNSIEELIVKLEQSFEDKTLVRRGNTRDGKEQLKLIKGFIGETIFEMLVQKKEYVQILDLWCAGAVLDWLKLYPKDKPSKISLPTYPFAKERYWIQSKINKNLGGSVVQLHPLLHENDSDLLTQKFKSKFNGTETFLRDHKVSENQILPGVAYLEMVREAGERSFRNKVTRLNNIKWLRGIIVNNDSKEVGVRLFPKSEYHADFEIYSQGENDEIIHSLGSVTTDTITKPELITLSSLKSRFTQSIEGTEVYKMFASMGLNLGASFQGIKELFYSENEALSRIELKTDNRFELLPGLLDSTIQTGFGMHFSKEVLQLALPFSVREFSIFESIPSIVWSYVRKSDTNRKDDKVHSYDVDLMDEDGNLLLTFRDFVALSFEKDSKSSKKVEDLPILNFHTNSWIQLVQKEVTHNYTTEIILLGGSSQLGDSLKERTELETLCIQPENESDCFEEVFEIVRSKMVEREEVHLLFLYANSEVSEYGFLSGLLKTAQQENPNFHAKLIGVDSLSVQKLEELVEVIENESSSIGSLDIRYQDNVREEKQLDQAIFAKELSNEKVLKEGGIYLITGGFGGLGQIFSDYILSTKDTRVILTGRSALSVEKQEQLSLNPRLEYRQSDVTDRNSLSDLLESIRKEYGSINGVLHSAGTTKDSFIQNKELEDIRSVLSPKIVGTRNLDELTKEDELDFMIYFSSIAGVIGNVGQSDYASANSYMDHYAAYRQELVEKGLRSGKTKSISWPYWASGGMQLGSEMLRMLEDRWGMTAMPTEEGIKAFENLVQSAIVHGVVSYGSSSGLTEVIKKKSTEKRVSNLEIDTKLQEEVSNSILEMVSELLKLPPHSIRKDKELGDYGFDSIMLTKFSQTLNEKYSLDLMPTVFFNYPTIDTLAVFLLEEHGDNFQKKTKDSGSLVLNEFINKSEESTRIDHKRFSIKKSQEDVSNKNIKDEAVAIIGMSGRFPGSPDLVQFWKNVDEMKDLISEIPTDRWDWKAYYGDPQNEKNKTKAKWGGFISDIDKFDPLFFNISPKEAEQMDPQQRILLEAVSSALQDAAITSDKIKGSDTGAFFGVSTSDYAMLYNKQKDVHREAMFSTGSAHSILVNRISYLLDIHGPSEPIDTACSSSLIAIHRAVENIRNGHCQMAIAGGVNALLSPEVTLSFSQAGMLSDDGRCKTFDQSANGYVRGEGVGVIVLKKLSLAEADGDMIYGVIRGTAENHGGKANSLTSPNPIAQKDLLVKAYRSAQIDPRDIGFIEAHGTGTPLGDPVETEGLKMAFSQLYKDRGLSKPETAYCGLGSVKSNVGHLEAAAGIAGVIKVILSMQQKVLPGNPHLKEPNAYLQLEGTPFYLQKETQKWECAAGKKRIAGVSSFGFGGANAHIILEEYERVKKVEVIENDSHIIVLSAKNKNRLSNQVSNLINYLEENPEVSMTSLSYTLQTGRDAMEERLALVVKDRTELIEKLNNFESNESTGIYTANIKKTSPLSSKIEASLSATIAAKKWDELADEWTKGREIEWEAMYMNQQPGKLRLPTYPFARDRYWLSIEDSNSEKELVTFESLHPMLHKNESDLEEQKFRSVYTGSEFFFQDHKVRDVKILPGVAYLEMAREAGNRSLKQEITSIKDVTWLRPVKIDTEEEEVSLSLFYEGNELAFEIYSQQEEKEQIHSQGKLNTKPNIPIETADLEEIKNRFTQSKDKEECYRIFNSIGLEYGTTFQGIKTLYYSKDEALSEIKLNKQSDQFVLHPGIMDSALQTCVGLSFEEGKSPLSLPFNVKEVKIFDELPESVWCHVLRNKSSQNDFEINIMNNSGDVLLQFDHFSVLPIESGIIEKNESLVENNPIQSTGENSINYQPIWERVKNISEITINTNGLHVIISNGSCPEFEKGLKKTLEKSDCQLVLCGINDELPEDASDLYILTGFYENDLSSEDEITWNEKFVFQMSDKIVSTYGEKNINLTIFTKNTQKVHKSDVVNSNGSSYVGWFGSYAKEFPLHQIKILDVSYETKIPTLSAYFNWLKAPFSRKGEVIAFRNDLFYQRVFSSINYLNATETKFRQNGVYVILGGAGGIGKVTTEYLMKNYNAQIVWLGRSEKNEKIEKAIQDLQKWGTAPLYISCDANDIADVKSAYGIVKEAYPEINGLFHSALVLNDKLIQKMEYADFERSFDPKAKAASNFADIFAHEKLDFMCFFSSVQSQMNSFGQANYSAGCTYKDALAHSLRDEKNIPSYIINWGYWGQVGVVTGDDYNETMKLIGIDSISIEEGMKSMEQILANELHQVTTIKFLKK